MRFLVALASLALLAAPATAQELRFKASLAGDKAPTATGSKATGQALISVDTDHQTVDVTLDVRDKSGSMTASPQPLRDLKGDPGDGDPEEVAREIDAIVKANSSQ